MSIQNGFILHTFTYIYVSISFNVGIHTHTHTHTHIPGSSVIAKYSNIHKVFVFKITYFYLIPLLIKKYEYKYKYL